MFVLSKGDHVKKEIKKSATFDNFFSQSKLFFFFCCCLEKTKQTRWIGGEKKWSVQSSKGMFLFLICWSMILMVGILLLLFLLFCFLSPFSSPLFLSFFFLSFFFLSFFFFSFLFSFFLFLSLFFLWVDFSSAREKTVIEMAIQVSNFEYEKIIQENSLFSTFLHLL